MTTILDRIVATKWEEVTAAMVDRPPPEMRKAAEQTAPPRDFLAAVTAPAANGVQLIAEIKKASPSAGVLVADFDAATIARTYHRHGAAAISVLTDQTYFQGRLGQIDEVKRAVPRPVLRKDFIVHEYQVYESRAAGADAILLIVEVLESRGVAKLLPIARHLGLAVLVEIHTPENLSSLMETTGPPSAAGYILGINNRDLSSQRTDRSSAARLAAGLPAGTRFVAESGIATRQDVLEVQAAGACAILVGESLLRAKDIGGQIDRLLGR